MTEQDLPPEFLELLKAVTGKRARVVIDHILQHGFITTEDLENTYGYRHPPRAIRDVREQGIPLETFSVKNAQGRTIAVYRFAAMSEIRYGRLGERRIFSKAFKDQLVERVDSRCSICGVKYEARYLQIDHCIPYEIAGDIDDEIKPEDYMLLCGSCNRAKSWSCEHCVNWLQEKKPTLCTTCYWASPAYYKHVALRPIRRLDVVWSENEVESYERLKRLADNQQVPLSGYVKAVLRKHLPED